VQEIHQDDGNGASVTEGQILAFLAPSAVGRADRLARQLLVHAGGQTLAAARLELPPFLSDPIHTLQRALDARIDVLFDVAPACPTCHVDRRALEEALLNLIANARAIYRMRGPESRSRSPIRAPA
jgi:signal transduction histidine kinase